MMQTKRHKGTVERFSFKGQSVGFTRALIIGRNRICVLVTDVEHGESLINTHYLAALEALRHWASHSTGTRGHVENPLIALQNEHFCQFLGEIIANLRPPTIKLRRMLRIMKMSLVPVAMTMPVLVSVSMLMIVPMFVTMAVLVVMGVFVTVIMNIIVSVFMPVFVDVIVCVGIVFVTAIMNVRMAVAMLMTMLVIVFLVNMLVWVFVFFAHDFIILQVNLTVLL